MNPFKLDNPVSKLFNQRYSDFCKLNFNLGLLIDDYKKNISYGPHNDNYIIKLEWISENIGEYNIFYKGVEIFSWIIYTDNKTDDGMGICVPKFGFNINLEGSRELFEYINKDLGERKIPNKYYNVDINKTALFVEQIINFLLKKLDLRLKIEKAQEAYNQKELVKQHLNRFNKSIEVLSSKIGI